MRCRYLVWGGPRDYKECDTLIEALDWLDNHGGEIFEPVGMSKKEADIKKSDNGIAATCSRCKKPVRIGQVVDSGGRKYHEGCARLKEANRLRVEARREEDKRENKRRKEAEMNRLLQPNTPIPDTSSVV
jgi:hypothetical protein